MISFMDIPEKAKPEAEPTDRGQGPGRTEGAPHGGWENLGPVMGCFWVLIMAVITWHVYVSQNTQDSTLERGKFSTCKLDCDIPKVSRRSSLPAQSMEWHRGETEGRAGVMLGAFGIF